MNHSLQNQLTKRLLWMPAVSVVRLFRPSIEAKRHLCTSRLYILATAIRIHQRPELRQVGLITP